MKNSEKISGDTLPANVLDALQRNSTIEAIKLLRAATGLGLKEAKDVIDQHLQGQTVSLSVAAPLDALPDAVIEAIQRGDKIGAIKLLRDQTGLGLKEAKDAVDAFGQTLRTLSPGEVPRAGNRIWLIAAVVVVLLAGYYFFMGLK